jgi:predicted heme/steroid binding protein
MSFKHYKRSTAVIDSLATLSTRRRRYLKTTTKSDALPKLLIVWVLLVFSLLRESLASGDVVCDNVKEGECTNSIVDNTATSGSDIDSKDSLGATAAAAPSIRMVTKEELATHVGVEEGSAIWLSVLGEVYDVTTGREYYAQGNSYGSFSGTDCSVCFVSGVFTKEEGNKEMDQVPTNQLPALMDWRNFYAGHETYKFVGYLLDDRFYDQTGKPTPKMLTLRERVKTALEAAAIQKAERDKKRAEMIQKRAEEKKNKEKQKIKITIPK